MLGFSIHLLLDVVVTLARPYCCCSYCVLGTVMHPIPLVTVGLVERDLPCFLSFMGVSTTTTMAEKGTEIGR